jgi:hypothetical protein
MVVSAQVPRSSLIEEGSERMPIKVAGSFRELSHGIEDCGSLAAAVSDHPSQDEDRIIEYLNNGVTSAVAPCIVSDVLQPSSEIFIGPLTTLTDGVWEWPSDLAYYVEKYHVRLPKEFVAHMREAGWQIPEKSQIDLARLDDEEPIYFSE